MEQELGWAGAVEISESDIFMIVSIYNDIVGRLDPFYFNLDTRGDFTLKPWCKDIITLIRVMKKLGAKPRTYIQAQISEYRKTHFSSRTVPTIKMMTTPAGIERYQLFCEKMGMNKKPVYKYNDEDMVKFNTEQMNTIMKRLNIENEIEFFKDPYLVAQLSVAFVKNNINFQFLNNSGFYKDKFGITGEEICP